MRPPSTSWWSRGSPPPPRPWPGCWTTTTSAARHWTTWPRRRSTSAASPRRRPWRTAPTSTSPPAGGPGPVRLHRHRPRATGGAGGGGLVASPLAGTLARLSVTAGQRVAEGDLLAVVEAMKMTPLLAPFSGTVIGVRCAWLAGRSRPARSSSSWRPEGRHRGRHPVVGSGDVEAQGFESSTGRLTRSRRPAASLFPRSRAAGRPATSAGSSSARPRPTPSCTRRRVTAAPSRPLPDLRPPAPVEVRDGGGLWAAAPRPPPSSPRPAGASTCSTPSSTAGASTATRTAG